MGFESEFPWDLRTHLTRARLLWVQKIIAQKCDPLGPGARTDEHRSGKFTDILPEISLLRTEKPTVLSVCLHFYCGKPFLIEKFLQV